MPVNLLTHWLTKQWFFNLFYNIFVKGPLYVVQRIGNVFSYLTGQQITNTVFNRHGDAFGMPHTYLVLLATAGVLMVLLGCLVILKAAMSSMVGKELGSLVRRFILVLIVVAMSSIIFFCANFLVSELILVVMPGDVNGKQLANQVGRIGFTDGKDHSSGNFTSDPCDDHYNLFVGSFGAIFCLLVFFILAVALLKRIFDLFLLYCVSPVVFATAAGSQKWQKVELWKDLVIARFISSFGAIISLIVFDRVVGVFFLVAGHFPHGETRMAAQLVFVCGAAIATLQSQTLFAGLAGATVGISDGISMLTTASVAGSALNNVRAGAMGVLARERKKSVRGWGL